MHITATCPRCQSQYQVEPELRGKRMRCPNVICRAVFEVGAEPATAAESSAPVVEPSTPLSPPSPPPPTPVEKPSWDQAPPPVRQSSTVAPTAPVAVDSALDDFPVDAPSTATEAAVAVKPAPKRVNKSSSAAETSSVTVPVLPTVEPHKARRRSLVAILAMLGLLAGGLAFGLWRIGARHAELEEERFNKALAHYDNEEFDKAVTLLQQLDRDYPTSDRQATYRLLAELGDVRQAVATPHEDSAKLLRTYQRLQEFLAVYQNDPLLKDRHGDVWQALHRMATQLVAEAERVGDKAFLTLGQRTWKEAEKYQAPPGTSVAEAESNLHKDVQRIEHSLARQEERRRLSELLAAWTTEASAARIRQARRLVQLAKFDEDAEFKPQLQQLIDAHRAQITFIPAEKPRTPPVEDQDDMLYLAAVPPVGKTEAAPGPGTIVLALARGVLYALDSKTGNLVWARRVGVDVSDTPLRIAAEADMPERAVVVSSDSRILAAVDVATGVALWRHQLDGVCLARPLLVDGKLLVPTLAGRIEEVEAASGRFLGAWQLDQPLTHGGAALPGGNVVYFTGAAE
jgi:tetratricopeptide (TPR) repeat protein